MVRLDGTAFQDIGIDGALRQELDVVLLAGFFFKHTDELGADDLALLLRIGNTGQFVQETVHGIHIDQVGVHLVAEDLDYLLRFAFAKQTVIDMNADQLLADGLDQQGRDDRAVHTAGQGEQDFLVANLLLDRGDLFRDKGFRQLGRGNPFHVLGALVVLHFTSSRTKQKWGIRPNHNRIKKEAECVNRKS